jgi:hypothetical protein
MTVLADHVAAIIVHRASMESTRRWGIFQGDIAEHFLERYEIKVPNQLIEEACNRIKELGGCTVLPSPLAGDMYVINADRALSYFEPSSGPTEHTSREYDDKWASANEDNPAMRAYYHGRDVWIRKTVEALAKRDLFDDESNIENGVDRVPASDRVVALDHNSAEMTELVDKLDQLEEAVRADNSEKISQPREKRRFIEQLGAAKRLLKLETLSTQALSALVLPVLTYLSIKFADETIGALAAELLRLLASLFGISF